jgi:hypothetical protein
MRTDVRVKIEAYSAVSKKLIPLSQAVVMMSLTTSPF